jgi:hypothetical protein
MSGHLLGPWSICDGPLNYPHRVLSPGEAFDHTVCDVKDSGSARLIAAAPELLEALRDIISWIPNEAALARLGFLTDAPEQARKKAISAIAKATQP